MHDTLTYSTFAWVDGYRSQLPLNEDSSINQLVLALLKTKVSRSKISHLLGLSHETVEKSARLELKPVPQMFKLVQFLYQKDIPLFLISNGRAERVQKDLEQVQMQDYWTCIYTKEDGRKPERRYIERILDEHDLDLLVMIGNDPKEDVWVHEKTICLQLHLGEGIPFV